jgi:type VI secretion system protein ImpG
MDRRLLNHYNIELAHLRQTAAEFAQQFPKIAGRLALDREAKEMCPNPFVARVLEGFAFLTARVQVKLDAEFPRLTQSLLETVYPQYLCPMPSMGIVRFEPDQQATPPDSYLIPRGTILRSVLRGDERTACEYRTAHDVQLWPLRLEEARYYTRDVSQLELPDSLRGRAAFRFRLQTPADIPLKTLKLDRLPFFLRGADETPGAIYEQIFSRGTAVVVQSVTEERKKPRTILPAASVRRVGFREEEALLPPSPRGFTGYRLLREYFAFPQRFLFIELTGLAEAFGDLEGNQVDLIIVLSDQEVRLEERRIDASFFELYCTPVINLFPKRADRILISDRFSEFHVVADKTRPLDFEVFDVESVSGYGVRADEVQEFRPFYLAKDTDVQTAGFFTVHRVPRVLSEKEKKFGQKSVYAGSEVYLSLVDSNAAPYRTELQQLGITALCTNRHLPIQMLHGQAGGDFTMELAAPVTSIGCITTPTMPRPAHADGELSWRIVSHLSLNYLSLLDDPTTEGASALRQLLKLYVDNADAIMRKQIEGIRSVKSRPIVRRVEVPGPIAFARGLEVSLLFDESAFEGFGIFILGTVIEQFFARYVSLNSFTETVIKSQQRGEVMRWKPQIGRRQLI